MSTQQTNPGIHVPITNPEAILRGACAEQRCVERVTAYHTAQAAAQFAARTPSTPGINTTDNPPPSDTPSSATPLDSPTVLLPPPPDIPTITMTPPEPPSHQTPPAPTTSTLSNAKDKGREPNNQLPPSHEDYMCFIMEAQHHSILQAQANWAASTARMECLKEALLLLSFKREESPQPPQPKTLPTGHIDLQRFRTTNGPLYTGPFHHIKPFMKWLKAVQIFFAAKSVTHDEDRIRVVGSLIRETNTITWYKNGLDKLTQLSWLDFHAKLIKFALPPLPENAPLWHTTLQHRLHNLSMSDGKLFASFSTKARTLQSMLNFEQHLVTDFALAEAVMFGLPQEVKALVNNFKLLCKEPFDYSKFKSDVQGYFNNLLKRAPTRGRACLGPINKAYIKIPSTFKTPPKPADYRPPHPRGPTQSTAGKPTQAPAGRPSGKSASVAAAEATPLFPNLDKALVAGFAAINKELRLAQTEGYVAPPSLKPRVVVLLRCGSVDLRGLVDTGSEINLISEQEVDWAGLGRLDLPKPTQIRLALHNNATKPILLRQYVLATLSNPNSPLIFPDVPLKIGSIAGDHDMILGTPFLSHFHLSVSVSLHSLTCSKSKTSIRDYCFPHAMNILALEPLVPPPVPGLEERTLRVLRNVETLRWEVRGKARFCYKSGKSATTLLKGTGPPDKGTDHPYKGTGYPYKVIIHLIRVLDTLKRVPFTHKCTGNPYKGTGWYPHMDRSAQVGTLLRVLVAGTLIRVPLTGTLIRVPITGTLIRVPVTLTLMRVPAGPAAHQKKAKAQRLSAALSLFGLRT
ncbi:hypothetical protein PCANC_26003 [Puccinia coronata f. sp. avenae]|uniref:Uncharacterized protein n=1 Tax=Puccinia coronata f. sp. avenae TaxID=200324 RepID=A0A2N5TYI4_9BASI|nr:hypothetical protein PCANC_26003 [Puccinia coronata f. sp. avenae]